MRSHTKIAEEDLASLRQEYVGGFFSEMKGE